MGRGCIGCVMDTAYTILLKYQGFILKKKKKKKKKKSNNTFCEIDRINIDRDSFFILAWIYISPSTSSLIRNSKVSRIMLDTTWKLFIKFCNFFPKSHCGKCHTPNWFLI